VFGFNLLNCQIFNLLIGLIGFIVYIYAINYYSKSITANHLTDADGSIIF